MADDVEGYLEQLGAIAAAWRQAGPDRPPGPGQVERFRALLDELYAREWDYALGWKSELPDEHLPARYLKRRESILRELEDELGEFAEQFRRLRPARPEDSDVVRRYQQVIEELFRIGHWSGEPPIESQLPDALMPRVYHDFWAEQIREQAARRKQSSPP